MSTFEEHQVPPEPVPDDVPIPEKGPVPDEDPVPDHNPVAKSSPRETARGNRK